MNMKEYIKARIDEFKYIIDGDVTTFRFIKTDKQYYLSMWVDGIRIGRCTAKTNKEINWKYQCCFNCLNNHFNLPYFCRKD